MENGLERHTRRIMEYWLFGLEIKSRGCCSHPTFVLNRTGFGIVSSLSLTLVRIAALL
jgi:hypothetical protein